MRKSRVTKQITTETSHRIWNHSGACKNIHGHSYVFEVTIEGDVDSDTGMVCDFKSLKSIMQSTIGDWDHALILHNKDSFVWTIDTLGTKLIVVDWMPTAENMAADISRSISAHYRDTTDEVISVKVWETSTSCAEWKKGDLLC